MTGARTIALNFFPLKAADFSFEVFRRKLEQDEPSVPGTRFLPLDCTAAQTDQKRERYEVSLSQKPTFEKIKISAWLEHALTVQVLHEALIRTAQKGISASDIELPDRQFIHEVGFILARHDDVREVMSLRAYALHIQGRFGFLCGFRLRVPSNSQMPAKRRLELSLTHKNGRTNEDFYLDQHQKIETFVKKYISSISSLTLHDGSTVDLDAKLAATSAFSLARRNYLFRDNKEGRNQFFGLRDLGPFRPADPHGRVVFVFAKEDRERSQHLFRALRGDIYSTFPGMQQMFGIDFSRNNVSGIEVPGFGHAELSNACAALKSQFPEERIVPVALVPLSKHVSEEETARYYVAKHAFISQGLPSQFVDRKRTQDSNLLKWSVSNIGLALFAKLGGVPWRVKPSTERCLIVGIGQAHRIIERRVVRYIAYSVLTDSSGGFETIKVLGNSDNEEEYIRTLGQNLRAVLESHSATYDSFVLHVTFKLKRREIDAIKKVLDELKSNDDSQREFVAIKFNDKNDFFGFSIDHNSRVPPEGAVVPLSKREFLLWFSGLSAGDSKAPKKPENPVHLRILYPATPLPDSDLKRVLQDAINIAGANWRGFNAKSMPISVYYAKIIANYYAHFREADLADVDFETVSPWFL